MNFTTHQGFVIGASRGLGAALVDEMLKQGVTPVIGIARTRRDPPTLPLDRGQYRQVELDVTAASATASLKALMADFRPRPLLAIYNAAILEPDLQEGRRLDTSTFSEINSVGTTGLGHFLGAVQDHLLAHGGVLIGISSFAAFAPPARELRIAYPATKAYLDMALRALRRAWRGRVTVVTVHLGHIGGSSVGLWSRWTRPSYAMAAHHILAKLGRNRIPEEINYTLPYTVVYKYLLHHIPDSLYFRLFEKGSSRRLR